jgi:anaerobic selenocysteine-containing dehydrogenase
MLDRLKHKDAPKLVVMDPRTTSVGKEATVHLKPRIGTNLAVLNGLQRLIIKNGWYDQEFIDKSVIEFENLKTVVEKYTPEYVEQISGVLAHELEEAAKILGTCKRLVSTALQGIYQSNQATASACAINNINLIRGMIGKPGAGILQMNGQPTAQNNRETGCDGEYPAFRNFQNMDHMKSVSAHPHGTLP